MGLLNNIKRVFVEEVTLEEPLYEMEFEEPEVLNHDTLIDDIYIQNGLDNRNQSIFKVEELFDSLPQEMVTETKRVTVVSILGSFGLTPLLVTGDGEKRIRMLQEVMSRILSEGTQDIANKKNEIEHLKKRIALLEQEITGRQELIRQAEASVGKELLRITQLINFLEEV